MDPLALVTAQYLQEGWKTRMLNPYRLPKKMQQKWQVLNDEKNLQIESKLIQVTQWKDKRKKEKRSIWSGTTTVIVSCWPLIGPPVQDAWGWASAPMRPHSSMANGPCLWHSSNPEVPHQDTAEDWALSVSAPTATGPLDLLRPSGSKSLQVLDLFTQVHGHPSAPAFLYTPDWCWVSTRFLKITYQSKCWIFKCVSRHFWFFLSSSLAVCFLPWLQILAIP